jgi:hypothetical protein
VKRLIGLLLVFLVFAGCGYQKILIVDSQGKVISEKKMWGKTAIIHVREDGTFETYSLDQGSMTYFDKKRGVYQHEVVPGGYYYYYQGRYYPIHPTENWVEQYFRLRSALMW